MTVSLVTTHGHALKILIDMISVSYKDEIYLEFTPEGLKCDHVSHDFSKMISFQIGAESMLEYNFQSNVSLAIQIRQLIDALKVVRKVDCIKMIVSGEGKFLSLEIVTPDNGRQIKFCLPVLDEIHQIRIDPLVGYDKFISLSASDFIKLTRDTFSMKFPVHILFYGDRKTLRISSRTNESVEKTITIGPTVDSLPSFQGIFPSDFLVPLAKINALAQNVKLFFCEDMPMFIQCNIQDGGYLKYYINQIKPDVQ